MPKCPHLDHCILLGFITSRMATFSLYTGDCSYLQCCSVASSLVRRYPEAQTNLHRRRQPTHFSHSIITPSLLLSLFYPTLPSKLPDSSQYSQQGSTSHHFTIIIEQTGRLTSLTPARIRSLYLPLVSTHTIENIQLSMFILTSRLSTCVSQSIGKQTR